MKRAFLLLAGAAILCTSCGLLPALNQTTLTTGVTSPLAKHLKATEDPGTGLYGYLNSYGLWAIQPTFRSAKAFDTELGMAVVQLQNGYWGAINTLGATTILFNFTSWLDVDSALRSISKGRYRGIDLWEECDKATGLWGYLDYTGAWFIAPQYKSAKAMSDRGIAVVQFQDGRWGAIDRKGAIVIQPNFNSWLDVDSAIRNLHLN
jgi:hypothetical protein